MIKKKLSMLLIGTIFFSVYASENFIISKKVNIKKMSKNKLKENIGHEIRDALNNCAQLTKKMGELQIELSAIQKRLFDKIEKLLDNKSPFKKAGKNELLETFNTIKTVRIVLGRQSAEVKNLNLKINKDNCLKKRI